MIKRLVIALGATALLLGAAAAPAGAGVAGSYRLGSTFGPYLWCLQDAQQECVGSNGDGNPATIRLDTYAKLTLQQLYKDGKPADAYLITNAGGDCLRTTSGGLSPIFSSGACGASNVNAVWQLVADGTDIYKLWNYGFTDWAVTYYDSTGSRLYENSACCGNFYRWHIYKG